MKITPFIYRWHQRLALLLVLVIIAWAFSGILHPLISRMSIPPAAATPAQHELSLTGLRPLKAVLASLTVTHVNHVHAMNWQGTPYYQVQINAGELPRYFDAKSGQEKVNLGSQRAIALARLYAKLPEASIAEQKVHLRFNDSYTDTQRYLPAYEIRFARDDELTVFVDAISGRPAGTEHRTQKTWRKIFQYLHTWSFLPDNAKRPAQLLLIVLSLVMGVGGLMLWWQQRRYPALNRLRLWHRRLGITSSISLLMFSLSGTWHVAYKLVEEAPTPASINENGSTPLAVQAIPDHWPTHLTLTQPIHWLSLQQNGGQWQSFWQTLATPNSGAAHEHHHGDHEKARSAKASFGWMDEQGAIAANAALQEKVTTAGCQTDAMKVPEVVERFGGDYGFLRKRLPVVLIPCKDSISIFVDPFDGQLAERVGPHARLEGWSFHYLHKWHFLDAFGKNVRDSLMAIMAFLLIPLSLVGVTMYTQRKQKQRARQ